MKSKKRPSTILEEAQTSFVKIKGKMGIKIIKMKMAKTQMSIMMKRRKIRLKS